MTKKRRLYLCYCEKSLDAIRSAIASFNGVHDKYKTEITLVLIVNAWELIGKAILIKYKESIFRDNNNYTFPAEDIILKLKARNLLDENQAWNIQQVISLRNEVVHGILPPIPIEILHHLFYFSCKFYKDIVVKEFPRYKDLIATNYLSMSFDDLTTYADKVQKLVGRLRKGTQDEKKIVWLLERGIRFEGTTYISQDKFEEEFKKRRRQKILPHLHINKFLKKADIVRIVPIQAPKNYTADINLRKGNNAITTLPVFTKKTDIEQDYPLLTTEIAQQVGKTTNFVAHMTKELNIKGDSKYHQTVRTSKSGKVNRYSQSALDYIKKYLNEHPEYTPLFKKEDEKSHNKIVISETVNTLI